MTEKELKKLNRYQLLELIILQTEQIADLEKQLSHTRDLLEHQQIQVSQAGSIAEAALQLSGIFEAAQSAADHYLANVKIHTQNADRIETDARAEADQLLSQAQEEANRLLSQAQEKAETLLSQAHKDADQLLSHTQTEAQAILEKARHQADSDILSAQTMLKETTLRCEEKENAVNAYITNIREAFQAQFQNLDQITKP